MVELYRPYGLSQLMSLLRTPHGLTKKKKKKKMKKEYKEHVGEMVESLLS